MDLNIIAHLQALDCLKDNIKTWQSASCLSTITVYLPEYCRSKKIDLNGVKLVFSGEDTGSPLSIAYNKRFLSVLKHSTTNKSSVQCFIDYDTITVNHKGLAAYCKAISSSEKDCLFAAMQCKVEPYFDKMLAFSPLLIHKKHINKLCSNFTTSRFIPQDIALFNAIKRSKLSYAVFGNAAVTPATFKEQDFASITKEIVFVGGVKSKYILDRVTQREDTSVSYNLSRIRKSPYVSSFFAAQENIRKLINPKLSVDTVNKGIQLQGVPNHMSESGTLFNQNYYITDPQEIAENHFQWGRYLASLVKEDFVAPRKKNNRPTIGLISHDFNGHVVGKHLVSLVKHLSCKFNYILYDTQGIKDSLNNEFKNTSATLKDVSNLYRDYNVLTDYIRKDNLDLAIDLSGHSAGNVLPVFSRRLAPKQATFLGYCHSTGLTTIDYRIVDAITDPVSHQKYSSEKLIYFPRSFICYHSTVNQNQLTHSNLNDVPTIGSFNNPMKMSKEWCATVARIMKEHGSVLLILKHQLFENEVSRNVMLCRFMKHGVSKSRIQFQPYSMNELEHLQQYDNIDISIDTFPYNGTTTTEESLIAGTPVACILGNRHASRVSASILSNCEESDFVASDNKSLVDLVLNKLSDPEQLYVGKICRGQKYIDFNSANAYARDFETLIEQILS